MGKKRQSISLIYIYINDISKIQRKSQHKQTHNRQNNSCFGKSVAHRHLQQSELKFKVTNVQIKSMSEHCKLYVVILSCQSRVITQGKTCNEYKL
jgi:hypothetical protein